MGALCAVLVAGGLGAVRAGRAGTLLGVGLVAISLAVIAGTNAKPGYQRDDWRGAAHSLPSPPATGRAIVSQENALLPLSIYLPRLSLATGAQTRTREVDFVALRTRHTSGAPLAPVVPSSPPRGFALAGVRRTESYALALFLAPRPMSVSIAALRRLGGHTGEEVILQR